MLASITARLAFCPRLRWGVYCHIGCRRQSSSRPPLSCQNAVGASEAVRKHDRWVVPDLECLRIDGLTRIAFVSNPALKLILRRDFPGGSGVQDALAKSPPCAAHY